MKVFKVSVSDEDGYRPETLVVAVNQREALVKFLDHRPGLTDIKHVHICFAGDDLIQ